MVSPMQDKIQEIMELVDKALNCAKLNAHYNARKDEESASCYAYELISEYRVVESKLRELVREPLSDSQINSMDCVLLDFEDDGSCQISSRSVREFARSIERAHNITNTKETS